MVSLVELLRYVGVGRPDRVPPRPSAAILAVYLPLPDKSMVHVGSLHMEETEFVFRYTREFVEREDLPPLPDFRHRDLREYRSRTLWPFFQTRLPPTDRPDVRSEIDRWHIDPRDPLQLLGRLGQRAITSPYLLMEA